MSETSPPVPSPVELRRQLRLTSEPAGYFTIASEIDSPTVHTTLPDDWRLQGAVIVVRAIDGQGQRRMATLYAGDVMAWEAVGMLHAALAEVGREQLDMERTADA